jgi:hypothetical protein
MYRLFVTRIGGASTSSWEHEENMFLKHRESRMFAGRLYLLSHVIPIHLVLFVYTTFHNHLRAKYGGRPSKPMFKFDMGFSGHDKGPGRQIFRTKNGSVGLGPPLAAVGDRIVLCKGGRLPLVLRKKGQNWELVGDCYVAGMAKGEKWDETKCKPMWLQ